ncbi:hypothetical protein MRB53_017493 [Persea americana]|uniref:Uncharacterized protein n=1 Tax=Persea americana TaxID=3435 RepID=A0ACC2M660_PERAE|nr:hypothetical protein MRB53_017493 [Persea americana]
MLPATEKTPEVDIEGGEGWSGSERRLDFAGEGGREMGVGQAMLGEEREVERRGSGAERSPSTGERGSVPSAVGEEREERGGKNIELGVVRNDL